MLDIFFFYWILLGIEV